MKKLRPLSSREIICEAKVSVNCPGFLKDHRVYNAPILPAAVYLDMVLAGAASLGQPEDTEIVDFVIQQALILSDEELETIKVIFQPKNSQSYSFQIFSYKESSSQEQILHAFGSVIVNIQLPKPLQINLTQLLAQHREKLSVEAYYLECRERGIDYGSSFQVMKNIWRHQGEGIAEIQLPEELHQDVGKYKIHPVLLDACIQVLWAALPENMRRETYLPVSLERLQLFGRLTTNHLWCQALLRPSKDSTQPRLIADVLLFDEKGAVALEIKGLFIERVSKKVLLPDLAQKQNIAITANFTADPVEDSLAFWMKELNLPSSIEFAPYNQVFQQLLDPTSLLGSNQDGVNVVLLRLEDWAEKQDRSQNKEELLANQLRYTLPNHQEIAHLNPYETAYLYQEIFVDQVYLKHGIVLNDGDCVIDVGANIGLFTLFVLQQCPNATIYAFEPAPHAFDKLSRNAKLYGKNVHAFNCGVADENLQATFTFYPNSSVFSSFAANVEQDEKAIRAVIINMLQQNNSLKGEALESLADKLLVGRLEQHTYEVQLLPLSEVIEENHLKKIDLLKIDAEKSELAVLKGIKDQHWSIIQQIVVEVHDQEGSIFEEVKNLLQEKGFALAVEEENLLQGSGLYNIYASRSTQTYSESPTKTIKIEQQISQLADVLKSAVQRSAIPHIVCICPASLKVLNDDGRNFIIKHMEDLLASSLDRVNGLYLIRPLELAQLYPVDNYDDPYGDKFGHLPYTSAFFTSVGTAIARKINALKSLPYKIIVLDCDGTLWKGICGEDGAAGVEIGTPYKALQEFIVRQYESGMLICLCSKNNEEDVWAVFQQREHMVLKRHHLVSWRLNWNVKSDNIKSLASELQVGIDSIIFIDDNPIECAEVQANCPEVLVLQLPSFSERIPQFLAHVWAFDHLQVTEESKARTILYQQNRDRHSFREKTITFADFLAGLDLKVKISPITPDQIPRVSQLTLRTNQFNLTTKRRSESELQQFWDSRKLECLVSEASDHFGDYGLVGVVLFDIADDALNVDTFLLSCRALGKGIEHQMLAKLGEIAFSHGLNYVNVLYIPSEKNQPALNFLERIGTPFCEKLETSKLFKLPVDVAARLSYTPSVAEPVHDLPSTVKPKLSTVNRQQQTLTISRIATELYDSETVLKVIESQKQKLKPNLQTYFIPPTNETEKALVDIWSDVLKLENIGIEQNFFEIGGSSLLLVQVYSKLREHFQWALKPVDLYQYPTIKALANYVCSGDFSPQNHPSLIPIQSQGSKPPLFCIHILGRGLKFYRPLAKYLGTEQPLYGLNAQKVNDEPTVPNRVEDLAAHYIEVMRTVQPEGPYYLVGLSFGGTIAFEMAQQLVKQGEQVALLALLDSYGHNAFSYLPISQQILNNWSNLHEGGLPYVTLKIRNLMGRKIDGFKKMVNLNLKKILGNVYKFIKIPLPEHLIDFMWESQNKQANLNYSPQIYPGRINLFFSIEKNYGSRYTIDPTLGWGKLAEKYLDIYPIPGTHLGMMQEPHVSVLAEKLKFCLDNSKATAPVG